jgi:hypothetical protein
MRIGNVVGRLSWRIRPSAFWVVVMLDRKIFLAKSDSIYTRSQMDAFPLLTLLIWTKPCPARRVAAEHPTLDPTPPSEVTLSGTQ